MENKYIKLFKLSTGEEIIASTNFNDNRLDNCSSVQVTNALRLAVIPERGVAMIPFSIFTKDDTLELNKIHIIYVTDPADDLKNEYNAKFGSGIVLPKENKLLVPAG